MGCHALLQEIFLNLGKLHYFFFFFPALSLLKKKKNLVEVGRKKRKK